MFVLLLFADLLHPFSIDIFEDYIYGVTYINNIVFRVNKFGKGPMENLTTGINHATDIVLYHRYKQPEREFSRFQTRAVPILYFIYFRYSTDISAFNISRY